jgi:hypothetical protein
MADSKITALTSIGASTDPANDPLVLVDVSDTSMAATGTTKKVTLNQLLGASGTATLASATITGDLTVASSILKVSGGNVGINTASPTNTAGYKTLEIVGTGVNTGGMIRMKSSDASVSSLDFVDNNGRGIFAVSNHNLRFGCNDIEQYRIQPLGIFTWYDGAGGTRMTLNSTGLLVGTTATSYGAAGRGVVVAGGSTSSILGLRVGSTDTGYLFADTTKVEIGTNGAVPIVLNNGGVRLTVDTSGNVGVGVTPSAWFSTWKVLQLAGGAFGGPSDRSFSLQNALVNTSGQFQYISASSTPASAYRQLAGAHDWYTAAAGTSPNQITDFASPKMTLDASGNLLVGTTNTNPAYNSVNGIALQPTFLSVSNTSGVAGAFNRNTDGIVLYFTRSGTAVGNVSVTTGGATFNSTSDYRLKESVAPMSGGLARVNALKPSVYKWKSDGSNGEGFIAHELAEVVPAAVNGEKDAVNEDGTIKAQSIDMSRIVPILVAAIKELSAEVNALKNA